jgi:hypothetical protein
LPAKNFLLSSTNGNQTGQAYTKNAGILLEGGLIDDIYVATLAPYKTEFLPDPSIKWQTSLKLPRAKLWRLCLADSFESAPIVGAASIAQTQPPGNTLEWWYKSGLPSPICQSC